jgi:hypothetical protein
MQLPSQASVRLPDLVLRGRPRNAQDLVQVAEARHGYAPSSVASSDSRLATARTDATTVR